MQWNRRLLAPWEEEQYFDTPTEKHFTGSTQLYTLLPPDPHRVAIIFSISNGAGTVSTSAAMTANQGMQLDAQHPTEHLFQRFHGPLVQMAWFGLAGSTTAVITVFSLTLRELPDESGISRLGTQRPAARRADSGNGG